MGSNIAEKEDMVLTKEIKEIAEKKSKKISYIRRHFHKYPELAFEEFETSKYIKKILIELGLEVKDQVAKTGVVGVLYGKKPGKTIAIRADMDALPMQELNEVAYRSTNKGKMHSCGHDAHMAIALGSAMILSEIKDKIKGNVKFIFQPAEETIGGAKPMIDEGVLENPNVDAILGGHVWGAIPLGRIGIKNGPIMASSDFFKLKIIGKGGHAANPHVTIDPVTIGSEVVNAFQKIISRQTDPLEQLVISICSFQSGNTSNIIPCDAILKGTVRTLNDEIRSSLPQRMENIIKGICEPYGAKYEFEYMESYPVTNNDINITELIKASASKIIKNEYIQSIERPSMAAEDFSFYLKEIPGTFIWIGTQNKEKGKIYDIHHPKFDIDEDILTLAASIYAQTTIDFLSS